MLKNIIFLFKSFVFSLAFIAIFVFVDALFVNWSLLANLCVTVGVVWYGITLWKWTSNIRAFKKSGMKLPEEPEDDDDDIIFCPAFSDLPCNIWYDDGFDDPFADRWADNFF